MLKILKILSILYGLFIILCKYNKVKMDNYLVANHPDKNAETLNLESQYLHKNTALVNQAEIDFVYDTNKNTCIVLGQEDTEWQGTCTSDKMDAGCIEKALCENKQLAKQLKDMQTATTSSNQRNNDTLSIYNNELLKAVNLGVGSVLLLGLIVSVLIGRGKPMVSPVPPSS